MGNVTGLIVMLVIFVRGSIKCFHFASRATEQDMNRDPEYRDIYRVFGPRAVRTAVRLVGMFFLGLAVFDFVWLLSELT